jgi:thioredoxin reductase (NADPH)
MSQTTRTVEILIVGGGPAGYAAGIYAARAGRKTAILEGRGRSRLSIGYTIENYPGFMSIDSAELLRIFRSQARHHGAELVPEEAIDFNLSSPTKYAVSRENLYEAKAIILATGKPIPRERLIRGEDRFVGQGVSYCATCDGPLYKGLNVAALGSSDEAAEEVMALAGMGCRVHWILGGSPEKPVAPEKLREAEDRGIPVHRAARVIEVRGERSVEAVALENEGREEELPVAALFIFRESLTAPLFQKAGLSLDHRQCVAVDKRQRTNIEGVFAAGDITCGGMQVVTAAGEGAVAALQAVIYVRKHASGRPGQE